MYYLKKGTFNFKRGSAIASSGFSIQCGTPDELKKSVPFLHPQELAYYHSLRFPRRKDAYLLGRLAAKNAVAAYTQSDDLNSIWIDFGVFGFPVVKFDKESNIQVSISHCENLGVAIAFPETHPMAIDLELIQEKNRRILAGEFTEQEKQLLATLALPESTSYTLLWTVKEGFSKVLRTGLTMNFHFFEVKSMVQKTSIIESHFSNSIQYKALSYYFGEYVFSLVLPAKTEVDFELFLHFLQSWNQK